MKWVPTVSSDLAVGSLEICAEAVFATCAAGCLCLASIAGLLWGRACIWLEWDKLYVLDPLCSFFAVSTLARPEMDTDDPLCQRGSVGGRVRVVERIAASTLVVRSLLIFAPWEVVM